MLEELATEALATEVVASCVNYVGVELNTASFPILAHVSGLGTTLAKNIVDYREENGDFTSRKELLKVPKMGKKTYEQCLCKHEMKTMHIFLRQKLSFYYYSPSRFRPQ